MSSLSIGYIGLGKMGAPMARRLLDAFGSIMVLDTDPARVAVLTAEGATAAKTPADMAASCGIVMISLPNADAVMDVLSGPNGILAGAPGSRIVVDFSTIGPQGARDAAARCAKNGVSFLDVPVGGGEPEAIAGTLALLVGGEYAAFEVAKPALAAVGETTHYMGASGMGQAAKLALNLAYGVMLCGVSEAFGILKGYGVDPQKFLDMTDGLPIHGYFNRPILDALKGSFPAGFQVDLMRKDLGLAIDAGGNVGLSLLTAGHAQALFQQASDAGFGHEHTSAVAKLFAPEK